MADPRAAIFAEIRKARGKGFSADDVRQIDAWLDDLGVPRAGDDAWMNLAVPLIEEFEGYARKRPDGSVQAYPDPGTGGKPWTIGIGSTTDEQGRPIEPGTVWTRDRAIARFKAHLAEFGEGVEKMLAGKPATPAQKAALASLAYNIGLGALARSTVLKRHRAGDYNGAADAFLMWNRAGGRVMAGLTRRRRAERKLYRGEA